MPKSLQKYTNSEYVMQRRNGSADYLRTPTIAPDTFHELKLPPSGAPWRMATEMVCQPGLRWEWSQ